MNKFLNHLVLLFAAVKAFDWANIPELLKNLLDDFGGEEKVKRTAPR